MWQLRIFLHVHQPHRNDTHQAIEKLLFIKSSNRECSSDKDET